MVESKTKNKKTNRSKSFHFRYLELCRAKNFQILPEIKGKDASTILDFFADKLRIDDWIILNEALYFDQTLHILVIRLRKNLCDVFEQISTEKRARNFNCKPVIYSKFVFSSLVNAISKCISQNKVIHTLCLEALPLNESYITQITKALIYNETIKNISFARSTIGNKCCECICNTIKHLPNIENLNLNGCQITTDGAISISNLIRFQKIYRYSEGWKQSLRYRDVNPETFPGLRKISLNNNKDIKDQGLSCITEVLKDDAWIKEIEMENCGITDVGGQFIKECLEINKIIEVFNVKKNADISEQIAREIRLTIGKDNEIMDTTDGINGKVSIEKVLEKLKLLEDQITTEIYRREQVEKLNEQLHEQLMSYKQKLEQSDNLKTPEGYTLIETNTLDILIKERDSYKNMYSGKMANIKVHHRRNRLKKAKSETKTRVDQFSKRNISQSEHGITKMNLVRREIIKGKTYVEKRIGDTNQENTSNIQSSNKEINSFVGNEAFKVFMKSKPIAECGNTDEITAKSLFMGSQ